MWVGGVELSRSWDPTSVARSPSSEDGGSRILVRLHGHPLGFVQLPVAGRIPSASEVQHAVSDQLAERLRAHLEADGISPSPDPPISSHVTCRLDPGTTGEPISLVVCTRDRPSILTGCLRSLLALTHGEFEVIVVDSASRGDGTQRSFESAVGSDRRFRLVREEKPGLSRARNRGLSEANHRLVAFTDDDVTVDPEWLTRIDAGFSRDPNAGCVTGLVPAARLDSAGQQFFEDRYSWADEMDPRIYDLEHNRDPSPLYPYSPGIFGTGANFAVDGPHFRSLGAFDEALGAGTKAAGGEDLDCFVRVLRSGRSLVREPSAIVWHTHRADLADLRRQMYTYGTGLTAFLTKQLLQRETAGELLRRVPSGLRRAARVWTPSAQAPTERPSPPPGLISREIWGLVAGPFAYLRSRLNR